MSPHRVFHGHSKVGIWMRIGIMQIAVSVVTFIAFQAFQGDATRSSNNRTTCVSSVILTTLKASSGQGAADKSVPASQRARSAYNAKFEAQLLANLRPVPPSLDCYALLGLPKPT